MTKFQLGSLHHIGLKKTLTLTPILTVAYAQKQILALGPFPP